MKVGLFGGSFDPIHRGHVAPVVEARRRLGLDRVFYLPTALPPHKARREQAPPYSRYAMVELAILGQEGLFASPFELTPDRPAYTVDTVLHFRHTLPEAELYLLIGSDSFAELHQWVRFREIVATARLAVLDRPGWDEAGLPAEPAALLGGDRVTWLHQPKIEVSSTRLRALLAKGEPAPDGMLDDLVAGYIRKYDLYR
jgi:nicotinate-nucleotide adenylyltransferase